MRLTNKIVEMFAFTGKKTKSGFSAHYEWDELSGFGVRIYPSGSKSFVVKYRNQFNRQRYYTIGQFPEISTSQARKEAEDIRHQVRSGEDPRADKSELKKQKSVSELADLFLELHAKPNKKTWKNDSLVIERHIKPRWGKLAAGELSRRHVQKAHTDITNGVGIIPRLNKGRHVGGPSAADTVIVLIGSIYRWAMENEYISFRRNPTYGIKQNPKKVGTRWVQPHELPWLLKGINELQNYTARDAIMMLLYTGCRPGEILDLRWKDVNLHSNSITFRETKNGKDHTVPLSTHALNIIIKTPTISTDRVFPGSRTPRHASLLKWVKKACVSAEAIAKNQGVEIDLSDVNPKNLRKTTASWLASSGYTDTIIGAILNHTPKTVTGKHYAHLADETLRAALEDLATQYHATLRTDSNVIPFNHQMMGNQRNRRLATSKKMD